MINHNMLVRDRLSFFTVYHTNKPP